MIDTKANEFEFKSIVKENIHRDGINSLMSWLNTTDFFTAPSSTRFHGSEPGGLCAHSIAVYKYLKSFQEDESDESIAIVALFHDLCKANFYKESKRNVKDESGKWIQVPYYEQDQTKSVPLGHGEKSMFLIMKHMQLTDEEACAVRWHMGFATVEQIYEKPALNAALLLSKLVLKLQTADSAASFWINT
jgi:hypothetical protein